MEEARQHSALDGRAQDDALARRADHRRGLGAELARVVLLVVLGLLVVSFGTGCASAPRTITKRVDGRLVVTRSISPPAYEHATRAFLFEEDGRLQEAADELERALSFDAEAPELWAHLGELETQLGHMDEASEAIARAEALAPTVEGALTKAAWAEARQDEHLLAEAMREAVARADVDSSPTRLEDAHLADAAWRLGALDTDGAFATLEDLVRRYPESARGRRQLAAVAWADGRMAEAEAPLVSLLQEDPNDLDAQLLLATLRAATDRPVEAKATFGEALSRSEEAIDVAEIYLRWLMERGDVEEAQRLADTLVVSDPTSDDAAQRTSRVERAVKRFDRARAAAAYARAHGAEASAMTLLEAEAEAEAGHAKQAVALFLAVPRDADKAFEARLRAAEVLREDHDERGAAMALEEAKNLLAGGGRSDVTQAERDAARIKLAIAQSQAAESSGNVAEAVRILEESLKKTPDEPRLVLARAAVKERNGHWQEALEAGEKLLTRDKRSVEALNFCGYVAADHHHHLPRALARLTAAAALDPGNGAILDSLGWAALGLGDLGKAASFLRQAARLDPADPEILSHVAELEARLGSKPRALETVKRALSLSPEPRVRRALEARLRELEGGSPAATPSR